MKKIFLLLSLFLIMNYSCKNQDWEFDDYDYTTTYFAFQTPVRTLVLGDYNFDNTNDNNHRFIISTAIGGVYNNNVDREVRFVIDETLTNNLYAVNEEIIPLPRSYYTLSDNDKMIIPKGSFTGGVTVQLNDAFFQDSLSTFTKYVIPVKIVSSTTDSILRGSPARPNPDPRIAGDWVQVPKDYTLFGIKYVNEYHGRYLLRGATQVKAADGSEVERIVYRNALVEKDEVVSVNTAGRKKVMYRNAIRLSGGSPGTFDMLLTFDDNDNCTITQRSGFQVTGTGKFVKNGDEWGGEKRAVLHLDYQINDGTYTHMVKDTLVFRDKAVALQEFTPTIR